MEATTQTPLTRFKRTDSRCGRGSDSLPQAQELQRALGCLHPHLHPVDKLSHQLPSFSDVSLCRIRSHSPAPLAFPPLLAPLWGLQVPGSPWDRVLPAFPGFLLHPGTKTQKVSRLTCLSRRFILKPQPHTDLWSRFACVPFQSFVAWHALSSEDNINKQGYLRRVTCVNVQDVCP